MISIRHCNQNVEGLMLEDDELKCERREPGLVRCLSEEKLNGCSCCRRRGDGGTRTRYPFFTLGTRLKTLGEETRQLD